MDNEDFLEELQEARDEWMHEHEIEGEMTDEQEEEFRLFWCSKFDK